MKKKLQIIALLLSLATIVRAQSKSSAFNSGDNMLNFGVGLGSPFFGTGYSSSLPVNPTVFFEHGFTDEISIGAQASYASAKYEYAYFGDAYSFKESATYLGVRGSYHLGQAFDLDSKFDVYAGGSLGYVVVSIKDNQGYSGAAASAVGYGGFAGARYFFGQKTGVYAELGYQSLSFVNIGLTLKF